MLQLLRMKSDLLVGAAAGAVGGVVGSTVMVLFNHALAATGFGREDLGARKQHRHRHGKPNETDGTISSTVPSSSKETIPPKPVI